ncbi:MAG: hypothetical protein OXI53_09020 [Nitrospira sp.]|nr:hypothetical protein [Nitrospira sp.]
MIHLAKERDKLLENFISISDELVEWLNENAYEDCFTNNQRFQLAVTCFYVALEHHKSIVLLISDFYYTSAFSLARPLVEAYVNGLWIARNASENDLEYFVKKGELKPNFGQRVRDIEKNEPQDKGVLSIIRNKAWSGMSNYVHSGMTQLSRHMTVDTIGLNFTDKEIVYLLDFVNGFGLAAGLWMKSMPGSTNHIGTFEEKIMRYNDEAQSIFDALNSASS